MKTILNAGTSIGLIGNPKHINVPPDFKSDDPATDPVIVEEARRLSADIEQTSPPTEHSPAAADEMEAEYARLRGEPFRPPDVPTLYVGTVPPESIPHLEHSVRWARRNT